MSAAPTPLHPEFVRPDIDTYFLDIAAQVATRSTCPRLQVGAVITYDKKLLGSGYNGSPRGMEHCTDVGCAIHAGHCIRSIHAEANALISTMATTSIAGATLYCTHAPCVECSKLIVNAGIRIVIFRHDYTPDDRAKSFGYPTQFALLKAAGVWVEQLR